MRMRKAVGDSYYRFFPEKPAHVMNMPDLMGHEVLRLEGKVRSLERENYRQKELLDSAENSLGGCTLGGGGGDAAESDAIMLALEDTERRLKLSKEEFEVLEAEFTELATNVQKVGDNCHARAEGRSNVAIVARLGELKHNYENKFYVMRQFYKWLWVGITGSTDTPPVETREGVQALFNGMDCADCGAFWPHRPEGLYDEKIE